MARRRWGLQRVRQWRSRFLLLRTFFAALVAVSFAVLLWVSVYENTDVTEKLGGRHHFWPIKHAAVNGNAEMDTNDKGQVGGPFSAPSEMGAGAGKAPIVAEAVWFSPHTDSNLDRNASWMQSVFMSGGRARLALPFAVGRDVDAVAPQKPRLFAFLASWRAYERTLMERGAPGDDVAAAADVHEEVQVTARRSVVPVKHVEVRLLRQRASRSTWASLRDTTLPIVGILPRESTSLASANEMLVESAFSSEGLVPLVAAVQPDSYRKGSTVVAIDTRVRTLAAKKRGDAASHVDGARTPLLPFPLVELGSAPRRRPPSSVTLTPVSPNASSTTTVLKWSGGRMTAPVSGEALEIALDLARPGRLSVDRLLRGEEGERAHLGTRDDTYTAALVATVCSARLVRLYGFSPSLSALHISGSPGDLSATENVSGLHMIPLNMSEEVELMVGEETRLSSGGTRLRGIVPLLYLELSQGRTADGHQDAATDDRQTVGLLWLHPGSFFFSTWASTATAGDNEESRSCLQLRGTAGATELYVLPGPTPAEVLRQYYTLTGFPLLPPRFLLGYHHGLQGAAATTQQATEDLSEAFRVAGVPLDSVWISDPTVAAGGTPFTWNHTRFPDPLTLQSNLWYRGRRYVVVRSVPTVPIAALSPLLLEGRRGSFFVSLSAVDTAGWRTLSVDGLPSHVVDVFNPAARKWYGGMLRYRRYVGSSNHTFINLQHSVPAVLASRAPLHRGEALLCLPPELRTEGEPLPMDVGHYGGVQHRQVHQLLTSLLARATQDGMLRRTRYHRRALTFIESYFVGTQRYAVVRVETRPRCVDAASFDPAAILTEAWSALRTAVRQCTLLGVLGIPFSGANLADGLVSRLMLLQLAKPPSTTATRIARVASVAGEREDDTVKEVSKRTAPPAPPRRAMEEMEQLLVRWYQAGVFFGAMYTDEPAAAAAVTSADGVVSSRPSETGPWWMRLDVAESTRQAIHCNLYVRYALLPYLYTAAYHASEEGKSFLAPLAFTSPEAPLPTEDAIAEACFAAGVALIVCPVTQPVFPTRGAPRSNSTRCMEGKGLFDLWTGVWHGTVSSTAGRASWWETAAHNPAKNPMQASKELLWLAADDTASLQDLPTATSLAPVLMRSGHIVATQNVLASPTSSAHVKDGETVDDAHVVHSTHMGANWTITVALPPLPPARDAATASPVLLAEGDVFWDEGSHASQSDLPAMKPGAVVPQDMPYVPEKVHHCRLRLKCLYEESEASAATARLTVEVAQTSESCAEALAELESHWNEEPQGFSDRLTNAKARRAARLHQLKLERHAQEEQGLHRGRGRKDGSCEASPLTREDLRGLRLPNAHDEATRNALWASHLLRRIRFLFQREEDAARLAREPTTTVHVERRSSTSGPTRPQSGNDTAVKVSVHAPHDVPDAHVVLVHLISDEASNEAAVSVFGARKVVLADGSVGVHVPPRHMWCFSFSLMKAAG
ncbi:hypothetical protein LSCM1_00441 [Leishmania martiniquensis]|uniref:Glycoside hydrolase family 31 TIM barrel domain-containing protein n=1 Tax=Leishmania martiniquensis TaxID=1580590 RepID=A0A836GT67_9TRYP|nr:hypothetical protein LSCM1_00441 [Leishmania martiniquensis]